MHGPRPDLTALERYHSAQVDVAVRLNTNESPYPPPAAWVESLRRIVGEIDWNRYPDRTARRLREALALRHGVGPDNVFVANGSNEVIQTLLLSYAGAGRTVATFEPTYQLHAHIARISGATVVSGRRDDDFRLRPEVVTEVVGRHEPHVTFLCSPNNPTGTVDHEETVRAAAVGAGLVIVDEAYAEFSDWSADGMVRDGGNVVVTRTFSKTWSLAAMRLGYAVAPADVVAQLDAVVLPYHLDAFKQEAGLAALDHADDMATRVGDIVRGRERLVEGLSGLGVEMWPSGANFVLFRPLADASAVWRGLVERGVLVRDCSSWAGLAGCLRVTVGTPAENESFLDALRATLGTGE